VRRRPRFGRGLNAIDMKASRMDQRWRCLQ
jgi:hypothetical protein